MSNHLNVAFTGTRKGMTDNQKRALEAILTVLQPVFFHHGMADGADTEAEAIVRWAAPGAFVIGYPAKGHESESNPDKVSPADDPLKRDRVIAKSGDVLIATPANYVENRRGSGTWTTKGYANQEGTPVLIIFPDGSMRGEV